MNDCIYEFDFNVMTEVRSGAEKWGPFEVDLFGGLPAGETVGTVDINAFVGRILPADFNGQTDVSGDLIEPLSITIDGDKVGYQLRYVQSLKGEKITLRFEITTSPSLRRYAFFLYYIYVT